MKKRIFNFLTALCLCLTLLPTMAAAEGTAGTATEVKTSDELVGALADHDKAVVKLVENTVTVAPGGKIESGTETKFMAKASNYGTISGGTFEAEVTNNGTISGGTFNGSVVREVSNDTDFLAALADKNVTTIKLKGDITVNATEKVKELTIGHITFLDANLTVKNASRVDATGVTISGGSYYCPVNVGNAEGVITGGSFYRLVTVEKISDGTSAYISGGTFYDKLKGAYAETDYSIQGREVTYMGGEDVYAMQVVNGKASAPDTPVKSGYRFVGWYNGNAKWDFDTPVTENLTLTAKWEKIHTSAPSAPRYDVAVSDGAHGSVSVSPKSASKGSTVTVTVTPDKGYALETLAVTDKNGSALDLTDKGGGQYTFTMPSSPVTVAATFMDDNTMLNFFVDVPAGAYYYDAVLWAAEGGIVTGTDAVHFSPDASCTRAQLVTFLWRAVGSPVVNYAMNFNDVDSGAYYAEAVHWAASEKIIEGTTAETFAPDAAVTRAQVVTMLYRFAKAQGMDTTQGGMAIREFDDFDAVPAYALEAMDWAVNAGVLKGDNNRLLPQDNCTRAQIVTMLYRALGEK